MLISARNASPWTGPTGNNTYLLRGRAPALIDAGVGNSAHLDEVDQALGAAPLSAVLITHDHPDHSSGVPSIAARWPAVRVVRFEGLEDERIPAGNTYLRPIHTPGHSPDHLCFFDEAAGDLYSGDLVRLGGTIVIPASRGGDMRQYMRSLRLVRELSPRRLLPGHGAIIDDPVTLVDEYLRHRAAREAQIVEVLRAGAANPQAIAARVYGELPSAIASAAADTVLAHLIKLEQAGRARRGANMRWFAEG